MRVHQSQLLNIFEERSHPETRAPAHMIRFLDHLSDDQKKTARVIRNEWRARETAADHQCFKVGKQFQQLFSDDIPSFAQTVYSKHQDSSAQKTGTCGPPTDKNQCDIAHIQSNGYSWAYCFSNPVNEQKKADFYAKFRGDKGRGPKPKANNAEISNLQARLAASEAFNALYKRKCLVRRFC